MTDFQERYGPWALITGASSGMGVEFARQLADQGLNLVLAARRETRLRRLSEDLMTNAGVKVRIVVVDLSGRDFLDEIRAATQDIEVGLLVNNAGVGLAGEFLQNDRKSELAMLHLNARAPLLLSHLLGKAMQKRGRGGMIFMSSIVALAGIPSWSHYAATKAYDLVLAEGLAGELKQSGVDVLAVSPGTTRTELVRLSRFGRLISQAPDAVVRTALKSLGKKRRVSPGLRNKLLAFSTRLAPRFLNSRIFNWVIQRLRAA